jgi:hypothetical protein
LAINTKESYFSNFKNSSHVPILLIGFVRPNFTARQIRILAKLRPRKVYFFVDLYGGSDKNKIKSNLKTRTLVNLIDWHCEVKTNFPTKNLGAKNGIFSAINWLFQKEKLGIILEDDVLPSVQFFDFCIQNLFYYEDDLSIGLISGHQVELKVQDYSVTINPVYSKFPRIWGWATWKNRWEDFHLQEFRLSKNDIYLLTKVSFPNIIFLLYLIYVQILIKFRRLETWDYQFLIYCLRNNFNIITPSRNLVKNTGFGRNSSNTIGDQPFMSFPPRNLKVGNTKIKKFAYDNDWKNYRIKMVFGAIYFRFKKIILRSR